MKNRDKNSGNPSSKRFSNRTIVAIVAVAVLLIGVATALSMQIVGSKAIVVDQKPTETATRRDVSGRRNYVTANAYGQHVVADRVTGQVRPLTQDESARLAAGLKQLIDQSSDGLVAVSQDDGTISIDLQGHFQNVLLAKRESDGTVTQECVDNLESAANFFEIDPKLVGVNKPLVASRPMPKMEDR